MKFIPTAYYVDGAFTPCRSERDRQGQPIQLRAFRVEVDGQPVGIVREREGAEYKKTGRLITSTRYYYEWTSHRLDYRFLDREGASKRSQAAAKLI